MAFHRSPRRWRIQRLYGVPPTPAQPPRYVTASAVGVQRYQRWRLFATGRLCPNPLIARPVHRYGRRSDAPILRHALTPPAPTVADFFDFVDMEEGYPFSGTGNVFRFVQRLISIAVQNKILVLFDNYAEGIANYRRCAALNVPGSMRILSLPDQSRIQGVSNRRPGWGRRQPH